ncbi:transmembrane domain-containing protein [Cryptosporidium canis]|uniref:Transmembrane domain-containing protein n=1 Tax=Cryptosporidium canis TaxID=195482 RepID=A0ABQ8P8J9_9CRYT|nr:transmembrane domain-containing protein [Cryptosporidium canis]KAJ1614214.1 transmembrane domain-containing protein [Cryptosporidium canis]
MTLLDGSFGKSRDAKKAENFAFFIKLLVWFPLYFICGLLFIIFAQTGWFVSMLASTGIQPYFEAPSIVLCPLTVQEGHGNGFIDEYQDHEIPFLDDSLFYLVLRSQGILGYKKAPVRRCGKSCLCFETSRGDFITIDNQTISKHPIEGTFIMKTSRTRRELSSNQTELNLSGRLDVDYLELWIFHRLLDPNRRIVKIGLYGDNTPLVQDDFPKAATWHIMKLGDVTLFLLRLIRFRSEEFSLYQILDLLLFFLSNRVNKSDASFYMYNIHSGHFINPSLNNENFVHAINRIQQATQDEIDMGNSSSGLTVLHLEVSSKFIKEVYKIGQSMSIAALIGCLVILIVLVNNVGVFKLCFKRRIVDERNPLEETKPKLCVAAPVKAISCYLLSENHQPDDQTQTPAFNFENTLTLEKHELLNSY